jgi:N-acetylated-alpha-linked acidic dipeptidase
VNYGTPEDYEELDRLGISVKGRIVIARYGRSWRGIKPKVAWEHGAVGCLIYSDPRDDGYFQGDVYPKGPYRPPFGAQRGSVMDMPVHPGDPLSPGWASEAGSRRLSREGSRTILKIPVLPISYADAEPLLRHLGGPVAREDWRGALPITYHVGPGPARVHLKLAFDWRTQPLYNVVARIDGREFPDEWIVHGNHHDAWVNGAHDPSSGAVTVMETARGLAGLLKAGWRPRRTIVLALWDGEEWGLLGSTEWGEKHAAELKDKAILYVNSDSTGKGWLSAGGSHSLQAFLADVIRDVQGPRGQGSVLDEARARLIDQARTDEEKARLDARDDLPLEPLGSGSDYTVFLDHLAIASLNLGYSGEDGGGVYHSIYDSLAWYRRFADGEGTFSASLPQVNGSVLMRMANADVVPFEFGTYARTIATYVDEIQAQVQKARPARAIDLQPVRSAAARLEQAGARYEAAIAKAGGVPRARLAADLGRLREINRLVYSTERLLGHAAGLPRRDWFKHLVYAPGFYTGYGVKTLPGVREAVEQQAWDEAAAFVPMVAGAIDRMAAQVERAAGALAGIAGG